MQVLYLQLLFCVFKHAKRSKLISQLISRYKNRSLNTGWFSACAKDPWRFTAPRKWSNDSLFMFRNQKIWCNCCKKSGQARIRKNKIINFLFWKREHFLPIAGRYDMQYLWIIILHSWYNQTRKLWNDLRKLLKSSRTVQWYTEVLLMCVNFHIEMCSKKIKYIA